jgi:hypothetical protein
MKAISIWNPFALLIVSGFKIFETRTWPAPRSVIGQRIGIASTKSIRPEQRAHFADEEFVRNYERLGLPMDLSELPHGFMLGTAVVDSVELMTEELLAEVSNEEQSYGWWQEGYYAWRMADPVMFETPIPVRGAQGLYDWEAPDVSAQERQAPDQERSAVVWRDFRPAER